MAAIKKYSENLSLFTKKRSVFIRVLCKILYICKMNYTTYNLCILTEYLLTILTSFLTERMKYIYKYIYRARARERERAKETKRTRERKRGQQGMLQTKVNYYVLIWNLRFLLCTIAHKYTRNGCTRCKNILVTKNLLDLLFVHGKVYNGFESTLKPYLTG